MGVLLHSHFDEVVILKASSSVYLSSLPDSLKFSRVTDKYVISPHLFQYSVKETGGEKSTIGPIGLLP